MIPKTIRCVQYVRTMRATYWTNLTLCPHPPAPRPPTRRGGFLLRLRRNLTSYVGEVDNNYHLPLFKAGFVGTGSTKPPKSFGGIRSISPSKSSSQLSKRHGGMHGHSTTAQQCRTCFMAIITTHFSVCKPKHHIFDIRQRQINKERASRRLLLLKKAKETQQSP